jgi:glutamate--cysteine ligase
MSTKTVSNGNDPVIENRSQLVSAFAKGEKPADRWRIGTEHEKFVYWNADHRAPSYAEPGGIHALLIALTKFGWEPIYEGENVIALAGPDGNVSLEPAGQLELSGAPLENLHQTCAETGRHLAQVKEVGDRLGFGSLGMGFWPDKRRDEMPIMPKGRYEIMLRHMPRVGSLGLDMMLRTCTIQVNLDYASEADMVKKFRVGLALQPLATALFANSPFTEGKPNGFLSYRSHIWSDTDPHRTGMLPFVFEDGFGYERYADYALDVPMYFVYRDGKYIDAAGQSFRDFLERAPAGASRREADRIRLDRSSLHRLSRSADEELPRDARRGRRPLEQDLRASRLVGRPALRRHRARRGVGRGQALDDGRAGGAAQCRSEAWPRRADRRRTHAWRHRARDRRDRQQRPHRPCTAQQFGRQ